MSARPSPSTSPIATPAPLCATAFVAYASPTSVFVNDTPVAVGLISVKPDLFVVGAAPQDATQARAKIPMRAVHFIESEKQTLRVLGMFISGHYFLVRKNFLDSSRLTG